MLRCIKPPQEHDVALGQYTAVGERLGYTGACRHRPAACSVLHCLLLALFDCMQPGGVGGLWAAGACCLLHISAQGLPARPLTHLPCAIAVALASSSCRRPHRPRGQPHPHLCRGDALHRQRPLGGGALHPQGRQGAGRAQGRDPGAAAGHAAQPVCRRRRARPRANAQRGVRCMGEGRGI